MGRFGAEHGYCVCFVSYDCGGGGVACGRDSGGDQRQGRARPGRKRPAARVVEVGDHGGAAERAGVFRYALLGPLTVHRQHLPLEVSGSLPKAVLAVLLLHPNETVSVDRLANLVWGEQRPASGLAALRNHVMRLRHSLGDVGGALVRTRKSGYAIMVREGERDIDMFRALCDTGHRALREQAWERAHRDLTAALALWRAEPLAGLRTAGDEVALWVHHLHESRLAALEGRAEALLGMGANQDAVSLLRPLAQANPLHEPLYRRLMLALYRTGRRAEALDAYRVLRRTLATELGVEPSGEVSRLQRRILNGDPALAVSEGTPA